MVFDSAFCGYLKWLMMLLTVAIWTPNLVAYAVPVNPHLNRCKKDPHFVQLDKKWFLSAHWEADRRLAWLSVVEMVARQFYTDHAVSVCHTTS